MFEQLSALAALAETGTMRAAGTKLHVSQSAISKRIAALEGQLDKTLVERRGRRAHLTSEGERLVARVRPLLSEMRAVLSEDAIEGRGRIAVGVSESVLGSWGATLFARTRIPELEIELHAHRSPVAIDRVQGGEYALALIALAGTVPDLVVEVLVREPMVIVPCGLARMRFPRHGTLEVITLDTHSETWRAVGARARSVGIRPVRTVENAFAAAAMAQAGLGHGLVPVGVANALSIPRDRIVHPPKGELTRPIALVARKSTFARPAIRLLVDRLRCELDQRMARMIRPTRGP